MRLLHVADRLTDRGGAYRHLLALVGDLAHGHEVCLAVGRREAISAPCPVVVCAGLDSRTAAPVPDLERLITRGRFDLVHFHNVMNPTVLRWAARTGRAIATVQDHRFFCPGRGKWTRGGEVCREAFGERTCASCVGDGVYFDGILALTRARLEALRAMPVIVLSEYMRGELARAGLDAGQVRVIPPFVDGLDEAADSDGPPCVAFVGRLAESKGVADAMAAWRRSGVNLPLVFAGTGPLRGALEREGLPVLGWLDRAALSRLYRRASAVLLPSRWQEPFGIVGPEAMAMGTPVVAWKSGGVGEWYQGEPVAWGDIDGLARALRSAAGQRTRGAVGLDRGPLMNRIQRLYEEVAARGSMA